MVGYQWIKSCEHVTGKLYSFLPKRPYLVRQRQQYVSGSSSGGTTSPRPFPSDQVSLDRKEGGAHLLQPSLQESKSQGLGISLPQQDVWVRSFYFFSIYCIMY